MALAKADQRGMLTASASRHQARQAELANGEDALAGSDGDGNDEPGGDAIDIPPDLAGGPL